MANRHYRFLTLLEVLQVSQTASKAEIKKAYHKARLHLSFDDPFIRFSYNVVRF